MSGRGIYFSVVALLVAVAITSIFSGKTSTPDAESKPKSWPGRNNTVLFLSNDAPGLSNVLLATSYSLVVGHNDLDVHYGSFEKINQRVSSISEYAKRQSSKARPIKYHEIIGPNYAEALKLRGFDMSDAIQGPGLSDLGKLCDNVQKFLMPWSGPEYLAIYQDIMRILDEVDPIIVGVDPLFGPGLDAIRAQGRNYAIISPNALKDNFVDKQPFGTMFWKYPAISSGYDYPVPWYHIPANIYINLRFIYSVVMTPELSEKKAFLKANGIAKVQDVFSIYQKDYLWLSAGSLEAEFPMPIIPSNVIPCGPIFLSSAPAAEQDAELTSWLERAPTVLINLGSSVSYNEHLATEMVWGIEWLLGNTQVQVLWKFNKDGNYTDAFLSNLTTDLGNGRLRMENWLKVDPAALMETGHIAVSVHHGGANCFMEAVGTGIPQIVLPMWVDLYDFATRAEYLGIGVWGNRYSAPFWSAEEIGSAFMRVLGDGKQAVSMRKKAEELGRHFQSNPGRIRAANEIAKLARSAPA